MESINKAIENTLHFITVIQGNCDGNRLQIEQINLKCYNAYLKEWNVGQREAKKTLQKANKVNNCLDKEEKEAKILNEELEQLMLADSVLEKARNIRSKNMVLLKQLEIESDSLSQTEIFHNDVKSDIVVSSQKRIHSDILKLENSDHSTLLRSKSAITSMSLKASHITHSKSYNECLLKKGVNLANTNISTNFKKLNKGEMSSPHEHSLSNDCKVSIISNEKLYELKNICINKEIPKKEILKNGKEHCSDSSQSATHHSFLAYHSFKNGLKSTSTLKHCFQFKKDRFWYPYLSSKNRRYLSEQSKCNTYENVLKVIKLIYKIQEMMLCIDLMNLIGKEVFPSLNFLDENDKNAARLCSYLSTMYHENLQRTTMLNLD